MKKHFYKKWWFWIMVAILLIGTIGAALGVGESPTSTIEPTEATTEATEELEQTDATEPEDDYPESYNKTAAWWAVQDYMEDVKGLNKTDWNLDHVDILSDGTYEVYCTRTMADGTTGTFKYIIEPVSTAEDGTVENFTLVEDFGQVL